MRDVIQRSYRVIADDMSVRCDRLISYPEENWRFSASAHWVKLAQELRQWTPPDTILRIENQQRKWEVVSAYQKCIRRGLTDWAQQLAGAVVLWDREHWRYFWTRITVTACEDVGYGDSELMRFVIACAALFPPSAGELLTRRVWSFLTARMCETQRSRIYCQLGLLEDWIEREHVPPPASPTPWDESLLVEIHRLSKRANPFWTSTPFREWHLRNNWRGQNLLKFAVYPLPLAAEPSTNDLPRFEVLRRLPDFCYDMHTRVGKKTCRELCRLAPLTEFFHEYPTERPSEAVGWAMFWCEGGLIRSGLSDQRLSLLENRFVASRFGWALPDWNALQRLMSELLRSGLVNAVRQQVLHEQLSFL